MKLVFGIILTPLGVALCIALIVAFVKRKDMTVSDFILDVWELAGLALTMLALGIVFIVKYH